MRKIIFLFPFLFVVLCSAISAQEVEIKEQTYHKNINLELLGAHFVTGINFDMRLSKGRKDGLGFRVGMGGFSREIAFRNGTIRDFSLLTLPTEINYVVGKKRNGLVAGAGIIPSVLSATGDFPQINRNEISQEGFGFTGTYALIGYRYTSIKNGLHLQFHYNPVFAKEIGKIEYFGLQLGVGFK